MLKVLLVEDSPEILHRLLRLLAAARGVEVVGSAATVAQALELSDRRCPDLVVLDVALRDGGHGLAVVRHLAKAQPRCKVVVLSNFGWTAMREAFLQAGACAYFDKAFEFGKARDWIVAEAAGRHAPRAGAGAGPDGTPTIG
ncbi:response regulator [Rubrivivax sp. RP6-9]|uniref:response regulator n=1 Tax=Rubrivivax sp. RP6-9 TaxID=3415750 RepID=UPI003CC51981